jgi:hypothetical protein
MAEPPLIPEGLEPRPEPVAFKPHPGPPGFVTLRGDYVNDRDQRFTLTAAALERHADALRSFTGELRVWFVAVEPGSVADAEQGPDPDAHRPDLNSVVLEGASRGDEPVLGCDVAPQFVDPDAEFAFVGHVEGPSPIHINQGVQHYWGSHLKRVRVAGKNVTLGGLVGAPNAVPLPPSPADHPPQWSCWIQGGHGGGTYKFKGKWKMN